MIAGTTSSGYEYEIDELLLDDYRFLDAVMEADSEKPTVKLHGVTTLCNFLLKENGKEELMDQIAADNNGRVPQEEMFKAIFEIINDISEKSKEIKNSSSSPE